MIENGSCYLVDGMGEPVNGGASGDFQIGERVYRLESGGKILSVTQNEISAGGGVYFLKADSSGQKKLYKKAGGQKSVVLTADYGIQSFCVVGQKLYYCAYVQMDGVWYSQIFTAGLDGENVQSFGERFPGTMEAMYYYESSGEIYGEYYPEIWNRGYGRLAAITLNGSIYLIQDEEQRQGETVSDHDRLNLVMVDGAEMICLWRDVIWSRTGGVTAVLWNKPVKLNKTSRVLMETEHVPSESETEEGETEGSKTEESQQPEDIVVQPITGNGGEVPTVPVAPPTAPTAPAGQGGSPAAGGIGGGASGGTSGGTSGAGGGENGDVTIIPIS